MRAIHRYARKLWALICLSPSLAGLCLAQEDGTELATRFETQVERRLNLPDAEQREYAELLVQKLEGLDMDKPQYVVLVDRSPFVQAAMIFWISPDGALSFIGASPASTGKP